MSKVLAGSGTPALTDSLTAENPEETATRSSAHLKARIGQGLDDLRSTAAHRKPSSMDRPKLMRALQTRQRLHRLRHELGQINPSPSSSEEARDEIVKAMARASLDNWSVPELTDESAVHYPDGSICIRLVAHTIFFNPTGAFGIVDRHPPGRLYFDMAGQGGVGFVLPFDAQ
ncbi:UNVERIFIED_ORG: hypothetical protein ABIC54_001359 [Burkholderia sp. 1263]